jgi:hypothetical protein
MSEKQQLINYRTSHENRSHFNENHKAVDFCFLIMFDVEVITFIFTCFSRFSYHPSNSPRAFPSLRFCAPSSGEIFPSVSLCTREKQISFSVCRELSMENDRTFHRSREGKIHLELDGW